MIWLAALQKTLFSENVYQFYVIYRLILAQSVRVLHPNQCLLIQGKIPSCLNHPAVLNLNEFLVGLVCESIEIVTILQNNKR